MHVMIWPISVVPIAAKILEKVVSNQLHSFLEGNELLSPYQGAYHHGKSTEQLLLVASDTVAHLRQILLYCLFRSTKGV